MIREQLPSPEDLKVFIAVAKKLSFAAAADELVQSPAYVSKRIRILETTLKTRLFHRTTRRVVLTEHGENALRWAHQILGDLDDLIDDLSQTKALPRGLLNVCSTFGFGRIHVAPAIAKLSEENPELEVRLELFDRSIDLIHEGFDLEIRVGDDLPEQHICKKLVTSHRVLCCSPSYLSAHSEPTSLEDLQNHKCLVIKERATPYGVWQLTRHCGEQKTVKVGGPLSANNGEIIVQWALNGRGIMLRSLWDVKPQIDKGTLVQILPEYSQPASVWGVYPTRPSQSAKLRVCLEFLEQRFKDL